jgi:hypothetical protein
MKSDMPRLLPRQRASRAALYVFAGVFACAALVVCATDLRGGFNGLALSGFLLHIATNDVALRSPAQTFDFGVMPKTSRLILIAATLFFGLANVFWLFR